MTPGTAVYGTVFTVEGTLACEGVPVPDAVVIVSRLTADPDDFETSAARTTDAGGHYRLYDRPSAAVEYLATWRGNDACGSGARSPLAHASVRPGVAANPQRQARPAGVEAVFEGLVIPAHPGASVSLQILQGSTGRWIDARWSRLDSDGRFRVAYAKSNGAGWLVFRIAFATQDGDHAWNVSRSIRADWT